MANELTIIPGVGKSITKDLNDIGVYRVKELKNKNPEKLYKKMCENQGFKIDRCMLYVLRCAVYFSSNYKHNPRLLK